MAKRTPTAQKRLAELSEQLAAVGFCLPGSLSTRKLRCGNPRCRCKADPPQLHGPYTYWTRKVGGRTVAQLLSAEQLQRYRPWIENDRRLRQLLSEVEALSLQAAEQAEGWGRKSHSVRKGPAGRGR